MDLRVRQCNLLTEVSPAEWDALTARPPASLAGSRAWLEAALATVDRQALPALIVIGDARRLIGLLPLVLDRRSHRPALRFAAAPFNDMADLLALPGHEAAAARAAIEKLRALAGDGITVNLEDLDPAGALAAADPNRCLLEWEPGSAAPTIDLVDGGASASPRQQRRWDRSLRRLRAAHSVEFRLREGEVAIEILPQFMRQRDARLRALKRSLCLPPPALLEAVVHRLAPLGRCAFIEMLVGANVVARDLYLLDRAVAMLWLRALDMRWLSHSCGHLLLRAGAERLAAEGFETLDLGRGDEPYKFSFGALERSLLNARLSPIGPDHSSKPGLLRQDE